MAGSIVTGCRQKRVEETVSPNMLVTGSTRRRLKVLSVSDAVTLDGKVFQASTE